MPVGVQSQVCKFLNHYEACKLSQVSNRMNHLI